MRPSLLIVVAATTLTSIPAFAADSGLLTLRNNPFSRPQVLEPKPPPPPPAPVVAAPPPPEEVELDLTATMVSDSNPMVMVDGELLGIGDRIQGLKLIAVFEGRAVFTGNGRKYSFEISDGRPK